MLDEKQREKIEYLSQYRDLMFELSVKEERLSRLDDQLLSIKSPVISDMPKGGGNQQRLQEVIARKIDLFDEINRQVIIAHDKMKEIQSAIDTVPNRMHRIILELRHVDCMTWEEMCEKASELRYDKTPYSIRHIKRLYSDALNEFNVPPKKIS